MSGWVWFGGCLLGLLGIEWVQRKWFPGGLHGRIRRREGQGGGGSDNRAVPFEFLDISEIRKHHRSVLSTLMGHKMGVNSGEELSLESDGPETADLQCERAEEEISFGNRRKGKRLLEQAESRLRETWNPESAVHGAAMEKIFRIRSLLYLQEGRCESAVKLLDRFEGEFGGRGWTGLDRARIELLRGNFRSRRHHLLAAGSPSEKKNVHLRLASTDAESLIVMAEAFLRGGRWRELDRVLLELGGRTNLVCEQEAALLAMKVERWLHQGREDMAWKQVAFLHHLANQNRGHLGLVRMFQVACARLHLQEGQWKPCLYRLSLAEEASLYPVASWEIQSILGAALEKQGRSDQASRVWRDLAVEAEGTFYGLVAAERLTRYSSGNLSDSDAPRRYEEEFA